MKDDSLGCTLLHPHFWYHGMNKIKGGKGYRNDIPLGPIGGKCSECDGDIISLKMNTSAKGFETTSEKVCNKCGLIVPGAFQTLEPRPDYKSKQYDTHEAWIQDQCMEHDDDIAWDTELYEHNNGYRMNSGDDIGYGGPSLQYNNINHKSPRLGLAINRLAVTPASQKQPWQDWKDKQYLELVDDYAYEYDMLPYQIEDAKWILNHRGKEFDTRYKMEDIIFHICLYVHILGMGRKGTRIVNKARLDNRYNRTLYSLIKDKLS